VDRLKRNKHTRFIVSLIEGAGINDPSQNEEQASSSAVPSLETPLQEATRRQVLPITRPWYMSERHFFFLKRYFFEEIDVDENWVPAYLGHSQSEPNSIERSHEIAPPGISSLSVRLYQRFNETVLCFQVIPTQLMSRRSFLTSNFLGRNRELCIQRVSYREYFNRRRAGWSPNIPFFVESARSLGP
jgi:hypothetical protein